MEQTRTKFYALAVGDLKTYIYAALFVAGNVILPQLCHFLPNGGQVFLPIFFFTLIAAYKYGVVAGLVTAVMSPLVNFLLFCMPGAPMLPYMLLKSVLLAVAASYVARRFSKVSVPMLIAVVLFYQVIGSLMQCLAMTSMSALLPMLYMAIPGMLIQVVLGYLIIRFL